MTIIQLYDEAPMSGMAPSLPGYYYPGDIANAKLQALEAVGKAVEATINAKGSRARAQAVRDLAVAWGKVNNATVRD